MSVVARHAAPAMPKTPVTPAAQTSQQPSTPSGSWKHPQFNEIARRQYATVFDDGNVRTIVVNSALLFASWYSNTIATNVKLLGYAATPVKTVLHSIPYSSYLVLLLRLIFAANIAQALLPLARRYTPDDIADIALTPSQRVAMGLKTDVSMPRTPGTPYASPNYVTPPRYQRSTPRSSFSNQAEYGSASPRSTGLGRSTSDSPFSPGNAGSPLFQKALGGSANKRLSYGGSPMGSSLFGESSSSAGPATPTPAMGKASVGLNNKWLYEKRRDSPRNAIFS